MISIPFFLATWASGRIVSGANVIVTSQQLSFGTDGSEGRQNSRFLVDQGALRWLADSFAMSSTERNQPTSVVPFCLSATLS